MRRLLPLAIAAIAIAIALWSLRETRIPEPDTAPDRGSDPDGSRTPSDRSAATRARGEALADSSTGGRDGPRARTDARTRSRGPLDDALGAARKSDATGGRVDATVFLIAAANGSPIAATEFRIFVESATESHTEIRSTDERGALELRLAAGDVWVIRFAHAAYRPASLALATDASDAIERTLALEPALIFRGRVVHRDGQPIAGAEVAAISADRRRAGRTAADGTFALASIAPGSARIVARHPGFASRIIDVEIPTASLLTVALEPRQALMLSVVDANAVPVAGARVAIRAEGVGSIDWPSESDASGVVEVHGLPQDDDSELIVDAEERDLGSARLRVSAGVLRSRPEIVLEPYAAIAGIVVDETGSPVAGARVVIIDSDRALRTTADGRFELRGLARGSYRVAASTIDRGTSDVAEVEITAADVVDLTLELRRGPASIRGHIVDSGDRAVALAEVALRAGEITFLTASAADGAFAFEGVPESDAVLSAVDGSGARATLRVASGDQAVRLRLAPPGDVVAAVDFAGATEDFRVDLVALDGAPKRTFRFSSESPLFHLRGVSTGEYRLEVRSASGAEIGQVEKLTVRSGNRTGPFLIGAEP